MTKLTILRGVSGSGKSTWARQQSAVVVSRDDLRVLMFGSDEQAYYEVPSDVFKAREQEVTVAQDALIAGFLRAGKDVIVDNTNTEWKFVKALAKIGYRYGANVEIKVFDVPLQRAINNNTWRAAQGGRDVKREIIERQHSRLQGTKDKVLDKVEKPQPYAGTPGKPKAFLVDIDGTLAHMRDYRGPFDWMKVGLDDVDDRISDIVNRLSDPGSLNYDDLTVVVMSGRDEACEPETMDWLDKHKIRWNYLFMRPEKDMRPDNIVNAELFDTYVRDNFDVQFVLDDRDQVVDMWRSMGITCLQVAPGDF